MKLIDARPVNTPNDGPQGAHSRSRYHFQEVGANTLRIKGEGAPPYGRAGVRREGVRGGVRRRNALRSRRDGGQVLDLFDCHRPSQQVAYGLMGGWYRRREGQVPHWLPPWLQRRTETAISKWLRSRYKRQLALASREAFRLQRTVFAATLTTTGDLLDPGFYAASRAEAPYLLEALANHRSAGIALANRAR